LKEAELFEGFAGLFAVTILTVLDSFHP